MPVESDTLWAEWNTAFEALKLAHEKLRGLVRLSAEDPERVARQPENGLTPELPITGPARKSRPERCHRTSDPFPVRR
jgi:hypothetical protein